MINYVCSSLQSPWFSIHRYFVHVFKARTFWHVLPIGLSFWFDSGFVLVYVSVCFIVTNFKVKITVTFTVFRHFMNFFGLGISIERITYLTIVCGCNKLLENHQFVMDKDVVRIRILYFSKFTIQTWASIVLPFIFTQGYLQFFC